MQSVLTGTLGSIVSLEDQFEMVSISWENGKTSRASQKDMAKVIIIHEEN